ncbi:hypothetical protein CAEBREN_31324 [Caenorhabditis brenneri]|uniref:Integrase catalytic domain-containing protein n=1 Tax=Caenorhabditis brenneri TaxID=135651 RepID=G0N6D7_CAEBE|nr:hypothetical protein CAEBREN_31324 [Caenorhabditis brenneri]
MAAEGRSMGFVAKERTRRDLAKSNRSNACFMKEKKTTSIRSGNAQRHQQRNSGWHEWETDVFFVSPAHTTQATATRQGSSARNATETTTRVFMKESRQKEEKEDPCSFFRGGNTTDIRANGMAKITPDSSQELTDTTHKIGSSRTNKDPVAKTDFNRNHNGPETLRAGLNRDSFDGQNQAPKGAQWPTGQTVGMSNNIRTEKESDGREALDKPESIKKKAEDHHNENMNIMENEEEEDTLVFDTQDDQKGYLSYIMLKTNEGKNLIGLIDTGANCCIISGDSARKNQLEVACTTKMRLKGVGSDECFDTRIYNIPVNNQVLKAKAYEKLKSVARIQKLETHEFKKIKDLGIDISLLKKLNTCEGKHVDMIIGTNVLWQLLKTARIKPIGPDKSVVDTTIGSFIIPTTLGQNEDNFEDESEVFNSEDWYDEFHEKKDEVVSEEEEISKAMEKLWNLNVLGIQNPELAQEEMNQTEEAMAEFKSTVKWEDGKLLVKLPMNGNEIVGSPEKVIRATRKLSGKREWEHPIMKKYMAAKPGVEGYEERRKAVLYSLILDHYKDTASRMEHVIPEDLNPMQDQFGLIRHGTRLDKSDLPTDTKLPIILIRDHKLTEMIVRDIHLRNKHIGTEQLVAECRRKYWIPKGRQLARKVINSCTQCKRKNGRTFRYPPIPPLPASRVQRSKPFEHIGIDYFGPIYYKGTHSQRKCWVLICTCVVTRNIHLELVSDNGTVEFILAMRRFFSRRGTPKTVTLDNARTFKLGEKIFNNDIKEMAEENDTFTNFMDQHPMEWKFITPLSPWKGGVYERIIGIVKKLLYSSGDTGQFNYVQLFTVITEIEGIVNSRPISHNPENFVEGPVVRPADFISPEVKLGVVHDNGKTDMADAGVTEKIARSHMAAMNEHMTELWKKWEDSYLTQLKISHNRRQQYTVTPPKVGQVVIMEEKLKARHKWPLARITEIHPNELGQIRTVTIKCNGKEIKRSVNQLIPLEMEFESPATMAVPTTKEHSSKNTEPTTKSQDAEPDKRREKSKRTTPADSHNPNVRNKIESNDGSEASSDQLRTRPFLSRKAKKGINYCEVAEDQNQKVKVNSENEERRTSEYGSNSKEEMAGRNKPHSHSLGAGSVAN